MENQEHKIIFKNNSEIIIQFFSESDELFNDRIEFIKKLEQSDLLYKEVLQLSKIYQNYKYKKCKYNKTLENKINI